MAQANLPIPFWESDLLITAYILITMPSWSIPPPSPYELWKGKKLILEHLCLWGSGDYIHYTLLLSVEN